MSFPVAAPYATWKTNAGSFEFDCASLTCALTVNRSFRDALHFLLLVENAGCVLMAVRRTNLMFNMEQTLKVFPANQVEILQRNPV